MNLDEYKQAHQRAVRLNNAFARACNRMWSEQTPPFSRSLTRDEQWVAVREASQHADCGPSCVACYGADVEALVGVRA